MARFPTPEWTLTRGLAYALIGFGGSFCGAALFIFRMFFLPGKSVSAIVAFSPEHPIALFCAAFLVFGTPQVLIGLWLVRRENQKADRAWRPK
jgi:hypothetical protein